jgi:hypothetical protein
MARQDIVGAGIKRGRFDDPRGSPELRQVEGLITRLNEIGHIVFR